MSGFGAGSSSDIFLFISSYLGRGQPLYLALFAAMIIFFGFFYTGIVFNPDEQAENLRKYGGFIPGIRPGENTSKYIDFVLTRLTVEQFTWFLLLFYLNFNIENIYTILLRWY